MQKHDMIHGQRLVDLFRESRKVVRRVTYCRQGPILERCWIRTVKTTSSQWWMDFIFDRLPTANFEYVLLQMASLLTLISKKLSFFFDKVKNYLPSVINIDDRL